MIVKPKIRGFICTTAHPAGCAESVRLQAEHAKAHYLETAPKRVLVIGSSGGYGLAILTGADPVFCVAVCTASTMGAVMRQPVMVVGLLLMCFPLKGIVCMIIAAVIAAGIPLPKPLRK